MAIEFHCNHCGKLVRAPEESGGKHAKCPACHQSVYIPTPPDQIEPLALEPIDDTFEQRKAALMKETFDLTSRILRDKEGLGPEKPGDRAERLAREEKQAAAARSAGGSGHAPAPAPARPAAPTLTNSEALERVIRYSLYMFEGKLAQAEPLAEELRQNMRVTEDVMQRLAVDELPPQQIAKIPRPLLIAFFKQLREQK
jgi:phage FluMu protein Com